MLPRGATPSQPVVKWGDAGDGNLHISNCQRNNERVKEQGTDGRGGRGEEEGRGGRGEEEGRVAWHGYSVAGAGEWWKGRQGRRREG